MLWSELVERFSAKKQADRERGYHGLDNTTLHVWAVEDLPETVPSIVVVVQKRSVLAYAVAVTVSSLEYPRAFVWGTTTAAKTELLSKLAYAAA